MQLILHQPDCSMYVPAGQGEHWAIMGVGAWLPGRHGRHAATETCPSNPLLVPADRESDAPTVNGLLH